MSASDDIKILAFAARHADVFHDLNMEWIETYFHVEDIDREILRNPQEKIIAPGGCIMIAEVNGEPVGCCALINKGDDIFEVSKMAMADGYRGKGIGRILLSAIIDAARDRKAKKILIISNTVLGPAIHLYKSIGFCEIPLTDTTYERGNIALEYDLTNDPQHTSV